MCPGCLSPYLKVCFTACKLCSLFWLWRGLRHVNMAQHALAAMLCNVVFTTWYQVKVFAEKGPRLSATSNASDLLSDTIQYLEMVLVNTKGSTSHAGRVVSD